MLHRSFAVSVASVALALTLTLVMGMAPGVAEATPEDSSTSTASRLSSKEQEAAQARQKLDSLAQEAEVANEEYLAIQEKLELLESQISEKEEQIAQTEEELQDTQELLAERVNAAYKAGNTSLLEVLLGSTSFEDFTSRIYYLESIQKQDIEVIEKSKSLSAELKEQKFTLDQNLEEQKALEAQAKDKIKTLENSVAEYQGIVNSLDAEVAQLVEQQRAEIEAQEAAELEARQGEALQAAAEQSLAPENVDVTSNQSTQSNSVAQSVTQAAPPASSGGGGGTSAPAVSAPAPSQPAPQASSSSGPSRAGALSYAQSQLGKPYAWGGTGPNSFDCSGLTSQAYSSIGVGIPRTSQAQYNRVKSAGNLVTNVSSLKPGDLVFFYPGISHVGIYAGGGQYIHAPRTGDVVKYSSLGSSFVGGGSI